MVLVAEKTPAQPHSCNLRASVCGAESVPRKNRLSPDMAACTNAKADGVEIYTIRLEVDDTDTGTLLQACASGADHYFDSPSADDLKPVFEEIRDRLTVVRLAS